MPGWPPASDAHPGLSKVLLSLGVTEEQDDTASACLLNCLLLFINFLPLFIDITG